MQTKKSKRKYMQKLLKESDGQWMGTVVQSQGKGKCGTAQLYYFILYIVGTMGVGRIPWPVRYTLSLCSPTESLENQQKFMSECVRNKQ